MKAAKECLISMVTAFVVVAMACLVCYMLGILE